MRKFLFCYSKSQTLTASTKSKSFQEASSELTKTYVKSKVLSVSADQKLRPKPKLVDKPLKEFRSDQTIGKPMKATKLFEGRGQEWMENCHGDYFQPATRLADVGYLSGGKKSVQQRRNSTSFSTITIGGDGGYGFGNQRHGVITASALMDLRTSIR